MPLMPHRRKKPSASSSACWTARTHVVVFDDPEATVAAVREFRARGWRVDEVFSPFPVHGIDEALGRPETRLPWVTLFGAAVGTSLALGFQVWTHAFDWPLNIGGKSNVALPALVPVTFELAVLLAALFTVAAFIWRSGMARARSVALTDLAELRVTDDQFAVLVTEDSAAFDARAFAATCADLAPVAVHEGWRVA